MPPGPLYNWLCVLHSAADIVANAASIRASQLSHTQSWARAGLGIPSIHRRDDKLKTDVDHSWLKGYPTPMRTENLSGNKDENSDPGKLNIHELQSFQRLGSGTVSPFGELKSQLEESLPQLEASAFANEVGDTETMSPNVPGAEEFQSGYERPFSSHIPSTSIQEIQNSIIDLSQAEAYTGHLSSTEEQRDHVYPLTYSPAFEGSSIGQASTPSALGPTAEDVQVIPQPQKHLQASRVPSSRIGRLFHYGSLAASLGYGAAAEVLRRTRSRDGEQQNSSSLMMTHANVSRLVSKLSQMRGAALKLGQFMSIQDSHILPKEVEEVFRRVQDSAHYMPNWQLERVMSGALGTTWRSNFTTFDAIPFAAASLGQVHMAVLAASISPTGREEEVAVKVQFPDVAKSVESDLGYLKILLGAGRMLPPGLFLDKTIKVMKEELKDECNYLREAAFIKSFAAGSHLGKDPRFKVPWVWEGSTDTVLVMERLNGVSVGGELVDRLPKDDRDEIATRIIELCMKELFEFRMMQTDPNWTNFLWNESTRQIELIDFGATREYTKNFMDNWLHLLQAAVANDQDACVVWSRKLGYLTGEESKTMLDAHVRSLTLLATPFRAESGSAFAFGRGTDWARITGEIRDLIPTMLRYRLTPPPRETYSLNRKLSGAFLLASRLNAQVNCRGIWEDVIIKYRSDP